MNLLYASRLKLLFLGFFLLGGHMTHARDTGILGKKAPAWQAEEWMNLPTGETALDVDDFKGKVLYLYCFQSWCPGCHSSGFPTLAAVHEKFKGNDKVAFVAMQTAFEGGESNSFKRAQEIAKKYKLTMPIGQAGSGEGTPALMQHYRTGGTPWTIIIDQTGVVRFNEFHISPDQAERLINELLSTSKN